MGELDVSKPEVLIYEPSAGMQLVSVEFVVIADTWLAHHSSPPVLYGQTFQFVSSPNRYGMAARLELHGRGGKTPKAVRPNGITP